MREILVVVFVSVTYWGCASPRQWPGLALSKNGCYEKRGWGGKPVVWCMCDEPLCNTNVTYIAQKYNTENTPYITSLIKPNNKIQVD